MGEEPESEAILLLILDSWRMEKGNRVCNFDLSQGSLPLATADSCGILGTVGQGAASLPSPLLDGRNTQSHDHQMSQILSSVPGGPLSSWQDAKGHIESPSDGELSPTMRPLVSVSLLETSVSSSVSGAVVAQSLRVGVGVTK